MQREVENGTFPIPEITKFKMALYILNFGILIALMLAYFKLADHYNIVDKPNERSSHSYITIRGGGVLFTLAALLWFFIYGFYQIWIVGALLLVATVSFLDDILTLPSKIRILAHFAAVSVLFWQLQVFGLPWYVVILAYLFTIGWINAFNFMDGINGITAFYGLVTLASLSWVNQSIGFASRELINILILSVVIFTFFNARKKAKTFAGDVGSVSLAFILAWFMISLILTSGRWEYILFFTVYGIDSVFSILFRLSRHENIFEAHRTHLYQYLSNELDWPHVLVAAIYAVLQLVINVITINMIVSGKVWFLFVIVFLLAGIMYLVVRFKVTKAIQFEATKF